MSIVIRFHDTVVRVGVAGAVLFALGLFFGSLTPQPGSAMYWLALSCVSAGLDLVSGTTFMRSTDNYLRVPLVIVAAIVTILWLAAAAVTIIS